MNETDSFNNYPKDRNWRIEPDDYDFDDDDGFDDDDEPSCTTQSDFGWLAFEFIILTSVLIIAVSLIISKIL